MSTTTTTRDCGWRCGETTPGHDHFRIIIREDGRLIGGLCPDGTTARNVIFQSILSRENADRIAARINAGDGRPDDVTIGRLAAKVVPA